MDTLTAQRDQASAALNIATINYARDEQQLKVKVISQAALDADKAALDQANAHLAETEANIATGLESTGRSDAIRAAEADVDAGSAAVASAQWKLDQKTLTAPTDAFVFDTLYRVGEYISAGQPVVSLLPPPNIRARFFVPEPALESLPRPATPVQIQCDGCGRYHSRARDVCFAAGGI